MSSTAEAIDHLATSTSGAVTETWEMVNAQREMGQLLLEAANPALAAAAAVGRYQEAQDTLASTMDDTEASERDVAEAKLAVAEAAFIAQAALDEFSGDNIIRAASAIAVALEISTEEAYELLESLDLLDGRQVTTVVTTHFRSTGDQGPSGRTTQIGGRQHGGPVVAGRPYVVGEAGPELIIPDQSGFVVNNADFQAMLTALSRMGTRGGDFIANFQHQDPQTDAQLIGFLYSVQGRMETI